MTGRPTEPPAEYIPTTPAERGLAMLSHLGGAFTSVIVPFFVWRRNRWRSRFVGGHSQEALNFQLTMLLALVGSGLIAGLSGMDGIILLPLAVATVNVVYAVLAARAARRSQTYRYPASIRFIHD